jgi:hypothetical protein
MLGVPSSSPAGTGNARDVERITYVGTSVLVDDGFGSLLLEYAAALARNGTSETIEFRGISEQRLGEEKVSFIVGPASEIVVEQFAGAPGAEPPENAAVEAFMQQRIAELGGTRPARRHVVAPEPSGESAPLVDGLDF